MTQQPTPTHLQAHFIFLQHTIPTQKKNKKSLQATAPDCADIFSNVTRQTSGRKEERTDNSTLPKVAVQCFV